MPIDLTPRGGLSISLENVRKLIAATTAWRTMIEVPEEATEEEALALALARIHIAAAPPPLSPDGFTPAELATCRPFAAVSPHILPEGFGGDAYTLKKNARASYVEGGKAIVWFFDDVEEEFIKNIAEEITGSKSSALIHLMNEVGTVIDGIWELSDTGTYLCVRKLALYEGPFYIGKPDSFWDGDNLQVAYLIEWGDVG